MCLLQSLSRAFVDFISLNYKPRSFTETRGYDDEALTPREFVVSILRVGSSVGGLRPRTLVVSRLGGDLNFF